ncbi:MAG: M20 family metallo-hydrolase [Candidatus Methanomethylophilaceae archaeon]|nr:M20 family metallo-hydrolase [Candidatus Methanomethylophilaceae archaeon]
MKSLETILSDIESSKQEIIDTTIEMIRIPALAPMNNGDGEGKKADYLMTKTVGFDEVKRIDVPDTTDPSVKRSNIIAVKKGKKKGTVWLVAHMDVVPTGDPGLWENSPFDPIVKDGKLYGRGTEDDGQSVISSMFAAKQFLDQELNGMSIGVAWVADEETSSTCGIQYLLDQGIFTKDDVIIVPDYCTKDGSRIDVAEKHILWLKFCIEGKTTHASTPHLGVNAYKVSTLLLMDLIESFDNRFDDRNEMYYPRNSTFEPTKRIATVENVNTIPGYDEFCMDIRLNPEYDPELVLKMANEMAQLYSESTGAKITVEILQKAVAGKPSAIDSIGYKAFSDSIEEVMGKKPEPVGIAGGTCSNFFRLKGLDAYAWQTGDGSLHAPNEYLIVDNLINDTKVFATLFYKLCM